MALRISLICAVIDASGNGSVTGAGPLQITTSSFPDAFVGTPYSVTMSVVGGAAPYTWSISSGALPLGLNMDAGGNITGTPTTTGISTFTVLVVDGNKNSASIGVGVKL